MLEIVIAAAVGVAVGAVIGTQATKSKDPK